MERFRASMVSLFMQHLHFSLLSAIIFMHILKRSTFLRENTFLFCWDLGWFTLLWIPCFYFYWIKIEFSVTVYFLL